jgi:hypothetical protein
VLVICYKASNDTVLKTGIKMIDVSCMVHVYKIANEKVANMYYLKENNHGTCILSFSFLVRLDKDKNSLVRYLTGTGCHRP